MKLTKKSVAIVIENNGGAFLTVKRAEDDSFAGKWGFPAASLRDSESHEDAAERAAKDKLGVEIKIVKVIGDLTEDKGNYLEHLTEYLVNITNGDLSLKARDKSVSLYSDYKFTSDPSILVPAAREGSLCSRIFLESKNISW